MGIVDPNTLVGRDVRGVLKERSFPVSDLHLFHSAGGEDGFLTRSEDEAAFVAPLTPEALEICRIAFLCGEAAATGRYLASRREANCLAIDLSGTRDGGPFVAPVPEGRDLPAGSLYLTYDATAAVLAEAVRLVDRLVRVEGVTAAVDRPASEKGMPALDELFQQAVSLASFKPLPKEVFEAQSAFNIFHPADTEAFEARLCEDFARLVERSIPLTLLSARAGVFHGHLLRVEVRTAGDAPSAEEVRRAFRQTSGAFEEAEPEDLSGPVESAGRDETLLLRVASSGHSVKIGLASDHLRRTGALMAVRLAEQVVRQRALLADA